MPRLTSALLPSALPTGIIGSNDGVQDPYGASYVSPVVQTMHTLAQQGTYFVGTNPTISTAIAYAVASTFSATAPLLVLQNNDVVGGKSVYLDYIRLIVNVVPASGTRAELAIHLDGAKRYASGGSAITPVNANMNAAGSSISQLFFGAVTASAASAGTSNRLVHRSTNRSVIPVVQDTFLITFGSVEKVSALSDIAGTTAKIIAVNAGPVAIGPQQSLLVTPWYPSNAATPASFEFEAGWWER